MPLITLVFILIVIGVLMGLLNKYGPAYIDGWYITAINVIVIICVVVWLLNVIGLLPLAGTVQVPRVR
jgi:hypothetical protein